MIEVDKAQTAEDLRAAARYIDDHGWHQGSGRSLSGAVCAIGATYSLMGLWNVVAPHARAYSELNADYLARLARHNAAVHAMAVYLAGDEDLDLLLLDIAYWNDAPGRTQAEVTAMMEKAAALVEEQE